MSDNPLADFLRQTPQGRAVANYRDGWDRIFGKRSSMTCGRCNVALEAPTKADVCWYCQHPLCSACWENPSHCGHLEAEAANERARAVKQPAQPFDQTDGLSCVHGNPFCDCATEKRDLENLASQLALAVLNRQSMTMQVFAERVLERTDR